MPRLTPGINLLARSSAFLAVRLSGVYCVHYIATNRFGANIPLWVTLSTAALSFPVVAAIYIVYKDISVKWRAAQLGARIAPRAKGKMLGNFDVLQAMRENWMSGYPGDDVLEMTTETGPCTNFRILWDDMIFTTSPEHIKLILATDFNNYVKGPRFHETMFSVLGSGVFNSDGEMWKFHRSMTRPVFTRDRISDYDLFDRHANHVISQLKARLRQGVSVDFQDLMSRFTLDSATEFLFGSCVHSLAAGLPYPHNSSLVDYSANDPRSTRANDFARAFAQAQESVAGRERLGWIWPLWEILEDKVEKPMKVVNAFIEPIIKEALEKKHSLGLNNTSTEKGDNLGTEPMNKEFREDETLLDHLVSITDNPVVIRDETLNIMIAGRDTTAATLTFVIYLLSLHPHVATRLRAEILEKLGTTRRPTYDDVRDLKYLRAVINETLRLFPIVPFNIRESINETVWPSPDPTKKPIYIPAGTKVPYSVFLMHRRKDLWGPDAEEFDPDRFLDDRLKKYVISNSFVFLPFNAGPRICLGQQFAYNEMSFMLIRLLQNFSQFNLDLDAFPPGTLPPKEWSGGPGRRGVEKIRPRVHLTLYSYGGLWVRMTEAEQEQ